jgi:hypothetical protein
MSCGPGTVEVDATYNCHTSASNIASPVHCVFHDSMGSEPAWFAAASEASSGCAAVASGSVLSKLEHLPALKGGQYHFQGTVRACIPAADAGANNESVRQTLIFEFLKDLGSAASEGRVLDQSARKGSDTVDLGSLSSAVTKAAYCVQNNADDPDPEPSN